jgi:putative ABC transport system ATP-binding protein
VVQAVRHDRRMLEVHALTKSYADTPVFRQVSLGVAAGEFVVLVGESGVGKSTLLNCIAGLDDADSGEIVFRGRSLRSLDADARSRLRREHLGFVFQAFHLLPHLNVADNVALPLLLLGRRDDARVAQLLARVGLDSMAERWPAQLSGGQLQRVALARALVHRPALILADEPTGNLDPMHAERTLVLLAEQVRIEGAGCLLVTHSAAAAPLADRVLRLQTDGIVDVAAARRAASAQP